MTDDDIKRSLAWMAFSKQAMGQTKVPPMTPSDSLDQPKPVPPTPPSDGNTPLGLVDPMPNFLKPPVPPSPSIAEAMTKDGKTLYEIFAELERQLTTAQGTAKAFELECEDLREALRRARSDNLESMLEAARGENRKLREALKHYTRLKPDTWISDVDTNGEYWMFDWDGDLQDNPWEIAEKALGTKEGA